MFKTYFANILGLSKIETFYYTFFQSRDFTSVFEYTTLHSVAYQLTSQNPLSPVQKLMSYISTPLLHHLSFSSYDLSISPSTLNYKAVT